MDVDSTQGQGEPEGLDSPGPAPSPTLLDAASVWPWPARWRHLLARLTLLHTTAERGVLLRRLNQPEAAQVLAFVNAHAMNCAAGRSAEGTRFFQALLAADVLLRDGSGMVILLRALGRAPGLNLNGTDLIGPLVAGFNGRTIALWGTREPYLSRARQAVLRQWAPDSVVSVADGFRPSGEYLALAMAERPALIVLGMGMPRQELVAAELRAHLRRLSQPCLLVCGGAILDFWGGKTPRAPGWLRQLGQEWLYRLAQEPRRLARRYVVGNPVFLVRTWRLRVLEKNRGEGD